jgi:hypothetical protein
VVGDETTERRVLLLLLAKEEATFPPDSFLAFILRFWNQILICLSVNERIPAISTRLLRVKYLLKWNSFSSSRVWLLEYVCRVRFSRAAASLIELFLFVGDMPVVVCN